MKKVPALLAALACALAPPLAPDGVAHARIESLDLNEMLDRVDGVVFAEIVRRRSFFVEEADGPGLYFTQLTLDGISMIDGRSIEVDVLHHGGFVDAEHGAYNSEAPAADDTAVGTTVIAFYRWVDNLGAGVSGNALYGSHGGIFRAVEGPLGPTVLGRGEGFAISNNLALGSFTSAVRSISEKR